MAHFEKWVACLAFGMLGSAAAADTITFSVDLPGVGIATLSGFDSSLGTLTEATITLSGQAQTFVSINGPGPVFETFNVDFRIEGPFGMVAEDSDTVQIACPDIICIETLNLSASDSETLTLTAQSDLDAVIGVGLLFEVTSAIGDSFAGSASLTYTFDPVLTAVPLPAGLPLLIGGIGLVAFLGGRRRSG